MYFMCTTQYEPLSIQHDIIRTSEVSYLLQGLQITVHYKLFELKVRAKENNAGTIYHSKLVTV